jgi:hypothetical protein
MVEEHPAQSFSKVSLLDGRVLTMAVRQQFVQFDDIIAMQFQFQSQKEALPPMKY